MKATYQYSHGIDYASKEDAMKEGIWKYRYHDNGRVDAELPDRLDLESFKIYLNEN